MMHRTDVDSAASICSQDSGDLPPCEGDNVHPDSTITDTTAQAAFDVIAQPSLVRQFYSLLIKDLRIRLRDTAATIITVLVPVFILFILMMLNGALYKPAEISSPAPLDKLSSLCPPNMDVTTSVPPCVSLGYTNSTPIEALDTLAVALTDLVHASEPAARVIYFSSPQEFITAQTENPHLFIAGVNFINVTGVARKNTAQPQVTYEIYARNTYEYSLSRIHTVAAYVQTAATNAFRIERELEPIRSPLDVTAQGNGIYVATVRALPDFAIKSFMPYYITFMFGPIFQRVLGNLAREKSQKLKAGLIMMCTNDTLYLLSTIVISTIFSLLSIAVSVVILYAFKIIQYASPVVLIVLFIEYAVVASIMGGIFAIFFPNPRQTATMSNIAVIFNLAMFGICQIFVWNHENSFYDHLAMLIAPVAFARAIDLIAVAESRIESITFSSFGNGNTDIVIPFYMIAVDIVLYWCVLWYLDKVLPGEHGGTPQHLLFFLSTEYWTGRSKSIMSPSKLSEYSGPTPSHFIEAFDDTSVPQDCHNMLVVESVTKEYPFGKKKPSEKPGSAFATRPIKRAVDEFSLNLHGDQILALLGHNGAGKTTTISMITGIVQPSSGRIYIKDRDGESVLNIGDPLSLRAFRHDLGVCPQFDVLFDNITVREHLELYMGIKGVVVRGFHGASPAARMTSDLDTQYIEAMARDVELYAKLDARVHTLSGGMKRKLSVAIALLGSPRVILLDEPTTGMDVAAQQRIWSLMRACKRGRVVILTTHSMEEAEVLGDHIAIIAAGKLKTLGTSIFLKDHFGAGYNINFEKRASSNGVVTTASWGNDPIMAFVHQHFPSAVLEPGFTATHATVLLLKTHTSNDHHNTGEMDPKTHQHAPALASFYKDLSEALSPNGTLAPYVQGISLNATTLEEVFLRFRDEDIAA